MMTLIHPAHREAMGLKGRHRHWAAPRRSADKTVTQIPNTQSGPSRPVVPSQSEAVAASPAYEGWDGVR
jgi:hypothetical protein